MKSFNASGTYRPFGKLKELLEEQSFALLLNDQLESVKQQETLIESKASDQDEEELFQEAMKDVVLIDRGTVVDGKTQVHRAKKTEQDPEIEVLACLQNLVQHGQGFVISDTPEYMEGTGYGVNVEIARRLHRGVFSVQDHIDLHGLVVKDAKETFDGFLEQSLILGKRMLLVIHGRGLSSQAEPVLKTKVKEWLTTGPWRKRVMAFTSARACDGGAGATYVLLRQRPVTKRYRKK